MRLIKPSQHGLGHLLNPTDPDNDNRDWITHAWEYLLTAEDGAATEEPEWFDRPAVGRLTATNPGLHRLLSPLNEGRSYTDQLKPFNFLLIAFVHPVERPSDEPRVALIAPYSNDPATWENQPWVNRYSGREYRVTTEPSDNRERPGVVTVKNYRDVLREYATNPEHKSAPSAGKPCGRRTVGLLQRRDVRPATTTHVGKEANRLDDAAVGLLDSSDAVLAYDETERMRFAQLMVPRLRLLGVREVARRSGLSPSSVHGVLRGDAMPTASSLERYRQVIRDID